jgi:metal transporter CNNM
MQRVGMGDSSDEDTDNARSAKKDDVEAGTTPILDERDDAAAVWDTPAHLSNGKATGSVSFRERGRSKRRGVRGRRGDVEAGIGNAAGLDLLGKDKDGFAGNEKEQEKDKGEKDKRRPSFQLTGLEQSMPADAVLAKKGADEVCFMHRFLFSCGVSVFLLSWCFLVWCFFLCVWSGEGS